MTGVSGGRVTVSAAKYSSWARKKAAPVPAPEDVEELIVDNAETVEEIVGSLAPAAVPNMTSDQQMLFQSGLQD